MLMVIASGQNPNAEPAELYREPPPHQLLKQPSTRRLHLVHQNSPQNLRCQSLNFL